MFRTGSQLIYLNYAKIVHINTILYTNKLANCLQKIA